MRCYLNLCLLAMLTLSGCSQKVNHVYETVQLATSGLDDVQLTDDKIKQIPYASIYARIGDGPQAFMVLGFYEQNQAKWLSADSGLLVTHHGRLVKTIGLYDNNLDGVTNLHQDPVAMNLSLPTTPKHWQRQSDWSPGYQFNHSLRSSFEAAGTDTLTILGQDYVAQKYIETVSLKELNHSYQNTFWIKPDTGEVLKSLQYLGPDMPLIEIIQLKRFQA